MKVKNSIILIVSLVALVVATPVFGQQVTDLRLNEMLIKNDSNYVDEYGRHVPWIEIFNSSYNSVNAAGCFLTDDTTGLADGTGIKHWYRIPKGDPLTLIEQRSSIVFFLDAAPLYGTFHTNFDPTTSKTNYVALINSNGKNLIDILEYPAELREKSCSYGYKKDGIAMVKDDNGKEISNADFLEYFTPGSTNEVVVEATKAEKLKEEDPYGIGLAVISMAVVFLALILIFIMLKFFGIASRKKKSEAKAPSAAPAQAAEQQHDGGISGEEAAAAVMALHLHLNSMHDEESEIITIETPSARYSPWARKDLTMKRVQR